MNYRNKYFYCISTILAWVLTSGLTEDAWGQARFWCEQKSVVQASSLDQRVTMPAVAAEGDKVYIVYRQGNVKLIQSHDRGKTWSQPVEIGTQLRVTSAPAIAVEGNKIVVVWPALVDVEGFTAFQLFFSQSVDGGQSFSDPKRVTQTQEDTFSPRFLKYNGQILLLWLETPLAQTLGNISTVQRPDFTPESVDELFGTQFREGSLEDRMTRVRTSIYVRTFNFANALFSPAIKVDVIRGQSIPHIFTLYGPIDGSLYIAANRNTEVLNYVSQDGGQSWKKDTQGLDFFDPRKMMDIQAVDNVRHSVWISRTAGRLIPVHYVSGDNQDTSLSPEQYVRYVPRLSYSDGVFHIVWEAGEEEKSWITYIRTDRIPPTSKITRPTDPSLTQRTATFWWEGNDNISDTNRLVYAYSYDGGKTWSDTQSDTSATINTPPDGEYVFKVRAEDVAGNVQVKPAEFAYNTFQSAPDTKITQAPPPSVVLNKRSVEVQFTGEDNTDSPAQLLYSCRADDGNWTPFQKGSSYTFNNLSNGQHVLQVRSKDSKGNIDASPAQCMVNVKVGLELVLDATPALSTNDEIISFAWKAIDDKGNPVQLSYYYQLDRDDVQELGQAEKLELKELEEGRHAIAIWGRHPSGDETPKESYQWLIDRTPPETTATFNKEYKGKLPVLSLGLNDPVLADGNTTAPPRRIQYQINDGSWIDLEDVGSSWLVPKPLSFYSWGYKVSVRAIDVSGNIDPTPATVDLRIHVRTNPYIFYSVIVLILAAVGFILRMILSQFAARTPRRMTTTPATSALNLSENKEEDIFSSSSSSTSLFEDDKDEKDEDDDIFS